MADKRITDFPEAASAGADYYLVTDSASDGVKKIKPANILPAYTGDVTSAAGSSVNTIAANAVTNAKAAQMAAGTIKSNLTAALASASDNTIAAVMDAAFGATQGAVAYRGASGWTSLAPGVSGQFFQTSGPAANPIWQTIPGGGNMLSSTYDPTNVAADVFNVSAPVTSPAIRRISSKLWDRADIRDWSGVDLTGASDSATVVQRAINDVSPLGQPLHFPAKTIVLDSQITWPVGCHLVGEGQAGREENGAYTYFKITHAGIGFQTTSQGVSDGSGSASRSIKGVNFKRVQPTIAPGFAAANLGYDIEIMGCYDVLIQDCMFLNPSRLLHITGNPTTYDGAGRVTLRNIKGQPLVNGITAENVYDCCFWDEVHFWPFWSFDANVTDYVQNNGVAFTLGRFDGGDFGRLFSFGYQLGMSVVETATVGSLPGGTVNLFSCQMFYSDGNSTGLLDTSTSGADLHFNRLIQAGPVPIPSIQSIRMLGTNSRLHVDRLTAIRSNGSAIYCDTGTGNTITVGDYDSQSIDADATGDAEFLIQGTTNKLRLLSAPKTSASVVYGGTGSIVAPNRSLKSANGYAYLDNGILLQWGQIAGDGAADTAVSFPIAFSGTPYSVTANAITSSITTSLDSVGVYSITSSGFTVGPRFTNGATVGRAGEGVGWMAIGPA